MLVRRLEKMRILPLPWKRKNIVIARAGLALLFIILAAIAFLPYFNGSCPHNIIEPYGVDYGVFSAGMRIQQAVGIPKYRHSMGSSDNRLDYERIWNFTKHYSQVVWDAARPNLSILTLRTNAYVEQKLFLPFTLPDADCLIVTFGVGREIVAEKGFKEHYPQCRFLGVDPDAEHNRKLFESGLGERAKFVQAALHGHAGNHSGQFLKGSGTDYPYYVKEPMEHVGIEEFFREHLAGEAIIDLLNIDTEGSEYSLLSWLARRPPSQAPIICQMNMEIHYPPSAFGGDYPTFFADLEALMKNYALLNTGGPPEHPYMLAYFVNVASAECFHKFIPQ